MSVCVNIRTDAAAAGAAAAAAAAATKAAAAKAAAAAAEATEKAATANAATAHTAATANTAAAEAGSVIAWRPGHNSFLVPAMRFVVLFLLALAAEVRQKVCIRKTPP